MGLWEVAAMNEEREENGGVWERLTAALAQKMEIVREAQETLERAEKLDEEVRDEER